ncbi:MAG: hypothetical protein ACRDAQ_12810, partial [Cetobacterium sp.]
ASFTGKAVGAKDVLQNGTLPSPLVAALIDLKVCSVLKNTKWLRGKSIQTFKYKLYMAKIIKFKILCLVKIEQ